MQPDTSPGTRLSVKVVAGSSRTAIAGWQDDTLRIRVAAAPEHGKANKAVVALLCKRLDLSKDNVRIVTGTSSPRKILEIDGLTLAEIKRKLST